MSFLALCLRPFRCLPVIYRSLTRADHKRKLITEVVYVTETVAEVVVFVNEAGAPYSTTTSAILTIEPPQISSVVPEPAPLPISSQEPLSTFASPSAEPTDVGVQHATTTLMPSSTKAESSSAAPASTQEPEPIPQPSSPAQNLTVDAATFGTLPLGITWDAYSSSANCKTADETASEFSRMNDYKVIRIYGMDCDQIPLAIQNALKNGQKLMGGAYLDPSGGGEDLSQVIQAYKRAIDQYADGNWDVIQLFSVENERVNESRMTSSQVVDAIGSARSQLRSLGYNGPVGAVETAPATLDNPAICGASDVVMVNIHAFFDRNTKPQDAGPFVKSQVERVRAACSNKRLVVTESGWPRQGNANGAAVPSPENQRIAIESIRATFNSDMFLFSAFDSGWKADSASTFNAERYWGVLD
jgi:exo-beta-1,3-glucanase (GH17 family)